MESLAKLLLLLGLVLIVSGVILLGLTKLKVTGPIPGDITIRGKSYSIMIPITSCLIISIILTIILNIFTHK